LAWVKLVFVHDKLARPGWLAVLIGAYMVFYQTVLWSLAGLRILRMIVLGLIGTGFVGVAFLPFFGESISSPLLSEKVLIALLIALALVAFLISWICVAHQRCGGGRRRNWLKALIERIADALPSRGKDFHSPAAAQYWFEWRRSGLLLPLCIGAMLILVIGPISWHLKN
jgi:multisubunit Na+/H+ antiporter MnhC subunit